MFDMRIFEEKSRGLKKEARLILDYFKLQKNHTKMQKHSWGLKKINDFSKKLPKNIQKKLGSGTRL